MDRDALLMQVEGLYGPIVLLRIVFGSCITTMFSRRKAQDFPFPAEGVS